MSLMTPYSSLYLHFPFCETKCHYCDFYSLGREKTKQTDASFFEQALCNELTLRGNQGAFALKLNTIFLGGGTPSMTAPQSMERIFKTLFNYTSLGDGYEWTMEANPSSILFEQFQAYRSLGINRVSMGVQSLNNQHLKSLGRVHDTAQAFKALDILFKAGFTNVSTDLLCGVPGQTIEDLRDHMTRLSEYPITHLSCYLLTLTKHHPMYKDLPNEEEQLRHLLFIDEFMRERGFRHYEISNFSKIDSSDSNRYLAKHNLVYWKKKPYLGFGPSAHSFNGQQRFKNFSSLHAYGNSLIDKNVLPVEWTEDLNPEQEELEKWMLALRLDEGFPKSWLTSDRQKMKANFFIKENLLEAHPKLENTLRATAKGFAISDSLIKELS